MNAIAEIARFLSYPFAIRAIVVGGAVSLCAALLGVTLVLKRYSMIGDGLSHVPYSPYLRHSALPVPSFISRYRSLSLRRSGFSA